MKTELGRTVAEMLQNCIPKEMIVLAIDMYVLALESTRQGVDETAERRRSWDREYRRNRRNRPPDTPDIHPTSADNLPLSKEDKKLSEVVIKKESKKERGSKIPPDWIPKEEHYTEGAKRGMVRAKIDDLAVTLRLWCQTNANKATTTRANWDSFFMSWIRREKPSGDQFSNNRTNTAAGRATAREADFVTSVGKGALQFLHRGEPAGAGREASDGIGPAEVIDLGKRAENAR